MYHILLQRVPTKENSSTFHVHYSVKIINPQNKGGYITEEFQEEKFSDVSSLRSKLAELFGKYMIEAEFQVGYLTPGHGFKGKQLFLSTDDDLTQMYSEHHGRRSINLWLKLYPKKHKRQKDSSTEPAAPQAKRSKSCESHLEKMDELQKIVDILKDKHKEGKYSHLSSAQFHCWGNTIQLGHHDSYEHPPNKPFFGATKTASIGGGASPGKRIRLRSECIDQLTKWSKLKNDGVITMEEYQDMHKTILGDIKKF